MASHMHLNGFLMNVGYHAGAWRHPRTDITRINDVRYFQHLARTAERGAFDSVFFADGLSVGQTLRHHPYAVFEPLTLLSAVAVATQRIGLIATASTTFSDPFTMARAFASLDHISGGRIGWNIVTSTGDRDAQNFGLDALPPHADRYRRASEFVDVATKLWDSWEDDALLLDTERGFFADPDRVHEINHRGEEFTVRGPLTSPRPPQGRPLLVQAGSSPAGRDFAARYAEVVFTAQPTFQAARDFYRDLKGRVEEAGRDSTMVKILPGICPVIGTTTADAKALHDELDGLTDPSPGLSELSQLFKTDMTAHPLDGPLPPVACEESTQASRSRYRIFVEMARRENLTIRELLRRIAASRGHRTIVGTPERIADELELWFRDGAADGFTIIPPHLPGGLTDFVDQVVPLLRSRGLFRTRYEGRMLREHYGWHRPANRFTRRATPV
nr:LLM class flavin-dependent oxidoreductase [Micromonospora sp. DSM 115978]